MFGLTIHEAVVSLRSPPGLGNTRPLPDPHLRVNEQTASLLITSLCILQVLLGCFFQPESSSPTTK